MSTGLCFWRPEGRVQTVRVMGRSHWDWGGASAAGLWGWSSASITWSMMPEMTARWGSDTPPLPGGNLSVGVLFQLWLGGKGGGVLKLVEVAIRVEMGRVRGGF